ncbi:Hypothetical protein Tpal_2729 [Trichococcus palustris]|jgi:uncharacterized protein|uniref:Uncharacterized protein n=1 Tax=Trichococcus palustris TaxID=140314 RepID=A0A143Z0G4_9LACT|nr:DsrE family protein [Trichococcus palustris]CZR02244.1 Hypothetical protein Tpal_2729 [Trichococcus palustris]SFL18865.1 hypothetical protein SAMN04488076_13217 [Trichococcus palustris]
MHRVIFHIDETAKWSLNLGNARNLLHALENVSLEILANSEAVQGYLDDSLSEQIQSLQAKGVRFVACGNAVKKFRIAEKSLTDKKIEVVPAGIAELVLRQEEGYSYIRP